MWSRQIGEEIGVNIPLENITGLEDGTPQAKANWVTSKAGEGYNDFYFTDDVYKNVKAVQDALEVLDVKSKSRVAYENMQKKLDRDFNAMRKVLVLLRQGLITWIGEIGRKY